MDILVWIFDNSPKLGLVIGFVMMGTTMLLHQSGVINMFRPPHESWQTVFFASIGLMFLSVLTGIMTI